MSLRHRQGSASNEGLTRSTVQGVFWIGGGQAVRQVIRALSSVVLARLLLPADFGLLGMAIVFFNVAGFLADFGIGAAIVQSDEPDDTTLSSAFWMNAGLSAAVAVLLTVFSPAIATFYGEPKVAPVIAALSLSLVITAVMIVPRSILYRQMDFGQIARAEIVASIVGSAVAIGLAVAGFGVWALVTQPLVGTGASLVMIWLGSRWLPSRVFSWATVAPLIGFSVWVLGSHLLSYASKNIDQLLIGRVWGKEQLGFYAMAFQLMVFPVQQVASVVARVLFPALAHVKSDPERIRGAYLRAVSAVGMVTFPMLFGLYAVSDDFVPVVFGARWTPMTPVLNVFCFSGMLITVGTQATSIFLGLGRTKTQFLAAAATVPLTVGAYFALVGYGIRGVALAFLAGHALTYAVNHPIGFRLIGLSWKSYLMPLSKPFLAAAAMSGVLLLAVRPALLVLGAGPVTRLAVSAPLGIALYTAFSWAVNRKAMVQTIDTVRDALTRSPVESSPMGGDGVL